MTIQAYAVRDSSDDNSQVVVFAHDGSSAKRIALECEWYESCEWIGLRIKRLPELDSAAAKRGEGYLAMATTSEQRLVRNLGWSSGEASGPACDLCKLYEWPLVPESLILEDDRRPYGTICVGCQEERKDMTCH